MRNTLSMYKRKWGMHYTRSLLCAHKLQQVRIFADNCDIVSCARVLIPCASATTTRTPVFSFTAAPCSRSPIFWCFISNAFEIIPHDHRPSSRPPTPPSVLCPRPNQLPHTPLIPWHQHPQPPKLPWTCPCACNAAAIVCHVTRHQVYGSIWWLLRPAVACQAR